MFLFQYSLFELAKDQILFALFSIGSKKANQEDGWAVLLKRPLKMTLSNFLLNFSVL